MLPSLPHVVTAQVTDPGINAVPIRCFDQAKDKAAKWEDSAHKSRPGYLYGVLTRAATRSMLLYSVLQCPNLLFLMCRAANPCEGPYSSQRPSLHSGEITNVVPEHLTCNDADGSAVSAGKSHLQRQHCCGK